MSKRIPTNEELQAMSNVFDEFAIEFCDEYGLGPLEMSGIFLARMTRMAEDMEYGDMFRRLLNEILQLHEIPPATTTNNSTSIH
jgi:hypothetical protein